MSCKGYLKDLHDIMQEILVEIDPESAQAFHDAFKNKLEKLKNEQATNLQENSGASR